MGELKLIARSNQESSSLITGDNAVVYCWDAYYNSLNQLPSTEGIQDGITERYQGYRLSINDITTDTYPPYKPREGRQLHSVKLASIGNGSLVKYSLNGTRIENVNPGTVIYKQDFENYNYTWRHAMGVSFAENLALTSSIDFFYSDDGVNYTADTRKRILIYNIRKVKYLPINVPVVNFNLSALVSADTPGMRKYIQLNKLLDALNYNTRSTDIDYGQNGPFISDNSTRLFFENLLRGRQAPYKIHISNIRGTNCVRYFDNLITLGMKIPIQAFKENKVWIDMSLYNPNNPPILDVLYGIIDTGIFRKNNL